MMQLVGAEKVEPQKEEDILTPEQLATVKQVRSDILSNLRNILGIHAPYFEEHEYSEDAIEQFVLLIEGLAFGMDKTAIDGETFYNLISGIIYTTRREFKGTIN